MKTNVVAAIIGSACAIKIAREPLLALDASPLLINQKPAYVDHPVDYFVPDFGPAHEIRYTLNSIKTAEKAQNYTIGASFGWKPKEDVPRDYFVPDFGVDEDILGVQSAIKSEEKIQGREWKPTQDANGYWNVPEAADNTSYAYGANYINNNGAGMGNDGLIQLESDPICASSGCTQFKHPDPPKDHPKDYFVPNFGQDHDVKATLENERIASKIVGKQWVFPTGTEEYKNAAKKVDYNFNPELSEDVRVTRNSEKIAESSVGQKLSV